MKDLEEKVKNLEYDNEHITSGNIEQTQKNESQIKKNKEYLDIVAPDTVLLKQTTRDMQTKLKEMKKEADERVESTMVLINQNTGILTELLTRVNKLEKALAEKKSSRLRFPFTK